MFNDIYEKLGVKTDLQRLCVNELIYSILREPSNKCGVSDEEALRKVIFGDDFNSLQICILNIAGYWFNDVEVALKNDLDFDGSIADLLFEMLDGREIMEGVVLRK